MCDVVPSRRSKRNDLNLIRAAVKAHLWRLPALILTHKSARGEEFINQSVIDGRGKCRNTSMHKVRHGIVLLYHTETVIICCKMLSNLYTFNIYVSSSSSSSAKRPLLSYSIPLKILIDLNHPISIHGFRNNIFFKSKVVSLASNPPNWRSLHVCPPATRQPSYIPR
jgi:hypothetical protein